MFTLDELKQASGTLPVTVRMIVKSDDVKTVAGSHYKNRISKVSTIIARINFSYAMVVDATRLVDGKPATFEPKPRKWGSRVGAMVEHKGAWYLETMPLESVSTRYFIDRTEEVSFDSIKEHIYVAPSKAQEEHQGLDKEQLIIVRDYKWSNVVSIVSA